MQKLLLIDLTSLYDRKITGLEIYGIDLYKALLHNKDIKVIPIFRIKNSIDSNSDAIIINSKSRLLTEQIFLPNIIKNIDTDFILYPVFPPGILTYYLKQQNTKIIPTIHDTVMWNYAKTLSVKAKMYLKPMYNIALKKADKIITITETVKSELELLSDIKIINFSNCISSRYNVIDGTDNKILKKLKISKDNYILSVSTFEPRKNFIYLLKIYKNLLSFGFDKKLVLVGRKGWGDNENIKKLLEELKDNIIFTDFISDSDLIALYTNCNSFYLLSVYEGFGRPPLEAMACGAKVYVSDIAVFREVLKDDAIYLPLNNIQQASSKILKTKSQKGVKMNKYNFDNFVNGLNLELLDD